MVDHLILAPGLRAVERGRHRWQIGMDPSRSLVLPGSSAGRSVIEALRTGSPPPVDPESDELIRALTDAGLAVPSGSARRTGGDPKPVVVVGDLGVDIDEPLAAAGLTRGPAQCDAPTLVLARGEIDRTQVDPLVAADRAHLVVRVVDGATVIGPFVQPGVTACLRCLDNHRAEEDPEYPAVLARYAQACARPRLDGVPDPLDPLAATVAVAWAVRDLANYLAEVRPASWSSTLTLAPALTGLTATLWQRHPACGCA